jgi:hypothetical protein
LHAAESPRHLDRAGRVLHLGHPADRAFERVDIERARRRQGAVGVEERHDGEGRSQGVFDTIHVASRRGAVDDAVDDDHLAVERVERADAEVAVRSQLAAGRRALVVAFHQRRDDRHLPHRLAVRHLAAAAAEHRG